MCSVHVCLFSLILLRPPRSTLTDSLFPYTTLFRSLVYAHHRERVLQGSLPQLFPGPLWGIWCRVETPVCYSACSYLVKIDEAHWGGFVFKYQQVAAWVQRSVFEPAPMFVKRNFMLGVHITAHIRRSEEHTSELQSLMRRSYAVFCLKKKTI